MKKKKLTYIFAVALFIGLTSLFVMLINGSFAATLDNDARIAPNSDLTYYIDVIYDGTDAKAVTSSDTATADVHSDYIYVEDKIPDGLIFKEFVSTEDGTIGAVKRSDGTSCPGSVVGDFAGLVYNESTRTVSFKVKNLQAGCKLTVGIVTTTPALTGKRMDFYNTAFARENDFSTKSNTVHAFMGDEEATLYSVTYNYTGTVPDNVPAAPAVSSYNEGAIVGVEAEPNVSNYTFSGWSSTDVTATNGSFTMPAKNVVFTGSFTQKTTYNVIYSITGDAPQGFVPPSTKSYSYGSDVKLDSLKPGDVVSGYRFLGWNVPSTVTVSDDGIFQMPNTNITITGSFEKIKYTVSYQFQGSVIPPNASSLLPATVSYEPGETVTVASDPVTTGYKFLGWYKPKTFVMPEENVVITGEWMQFSGYFTPSISIDIANKKDTYQAGDVVNFNIVVTNNESFAIKDVMIQEKLDGATFVNNGTSYTVMNDSFVKLNTLAANASVTILAKYVVSNDIVKDYVNVVELTGALADSGYYLDTTKDYKVSVNFKVSNIVLNVILKNIFGNNLTNSQFTLYEDANLSTEFGKGMNFIGLVPGKTYYLKQTKVDSGYQILSNTYTVVVGDDGSITFDGTNIPNTTGTVDVNLVNEEINMLPNTGGPGNIPYMIIGILMILISSVGYVSYTKRKRSLV